MNYDHNKTSRLFKFQSGYRKLYSRKIINAQTGPNPNIFCIKSIFWKVAKCP